MSQAILHSESKIGHILTFMDLDFQLQSSWLLCYKVDSKVDNELLQRPEKLRYHKLFRCDPESLGTSNSPDYPCPSPEMRSPSTATRHRPRVWYPIGWWWQPLPVTPYAK
jgi:hypothetical protein